MNNHTKYTHRFLARLVIEAATPLAVGSGTRDITTDALVIKDVNDLPYIPGTALSGLFRQNFDETIANQLFGYQGKLDSKEGNGSVTIFSDAKLVGIDGAVIDGLITIDWQNDFYQRFKELPIRQHVRINSKGVTEEGGKFDQQIVYKGTRFCFEIEMLSVDGDKVHFIKMLNNLNSRTFRIGGGTRCGFGEIEVVSCIFKTFDLHKNEDLNSYLQKTSSLTNRFDGELLISNHIDEHWMNYKLTLQPQDFFLFSSGFGDDEADITFVHEAQIKWKEDKPQFEDNCVLIPASSIKGALSHRVAYHWNKLKGRFADKPDTNPLTGNKNPAVQALFGFEGEDKQTIGNVLFSDIIESKPIQEKLINHVMIDRFTGGAVDGALFSEKTTYIEPSENHLHFDLWVTKTSIADESVKTAFENALSDICNGFLPLGGGVNRGNGIFNGKWEVKK